MKQNSYLFSIIIPVYNVNLYLKDCVESILNQHFNDCEIILVDDGSSDGSELICDYYSNKYHNITVIHKKNEGPGIARNVGIRSSSGKYIIFLDSDDMLVENALDKCKELVLNYDSDVFLGQKFKILFPRGSIKEKIDEIKVKSLEDNILRNLLNENSISITYVWRNIYRKQLIEENKIYFSENILCGEDTDWNIKIFLHAKKISTINFFTHIYRRNRPGSIVTMCSYNRVSDFYKVVSKWIEYADTLKDNELSMAIKRYYSLSFYDNLKYIYNFKNNSELISNISNGKFWKYPFTTKNKIILILKKIIGIKATLIILNTENRFKNWIKVKLVFLKLIDR